MEEDKWMDEVFDSMKGSRRARPRLEVFDNIRDRIKTPEAKVIPLRQLRYVAAAAALILAVNAAALIYYSQYGGASGENIVAADAYNQPLISSYQIYE